MDNSHFLNVYDFTHKYLDHMTIYGFPHRLKGNISQEHKKQCDDFRLDFLEAKLQRKLHGLRFCTVFFHADLIYRMSDL